MEEKTLFKLARAITDTGTGTVSSEGGTITYRITSLKRKLVNGKVVSTSTPSCTLGSASVSWATWGGVTVGDGYLDVKINYSENTGSSRSTTLIFTQIESDNKINLTVTQGGNIPITYTYDLMCILENGDDRTEWSPNGNAMVYYIEPGSQILKVEGVKIGWKGQNKYNDRYMELITSSMKNHTGDDLHFTYQPTYQYLNVTVPDRYSGYYYGTISMFGQIRENSQYIDQTFLFYQR